MESLIFIIIGAVAVVIVLLFSLLTAKKKEKKQNSVKLVNPKEMYLMPKKPDIQEVKIDNSITNPLTSSNRPIVEKKKEQKKEPIEKNNNDLPDDYRKVNKLQNFNMYNNSQKNIIPDRQIPVNQALNNNQANLTNSLNNQQNKQFNNSPKQPFNNVNFVNNNFKK